VKVWLATSGEYSDYTVCHVFARQEDAEAYEGAGRVEEFELREGPVEMRPWHTLLWRADDPDHEKDSLRLANPYGSSWPKDFDGRPEYAAHRWDGPPERTGPILTVEGWDLQRVMKVYSEQRAQYLASH
jgi:hypothetical protein